MTNNELLADVLGRNLEFLKMTLADFSDAQMLVRPCPGANHTAWQLGHLISAETGMVSGTKTAAMPALPAAFREKFTKETASVDTPASFPSKAQLLEQFAKTRAGSIAWVKALTPADMAKPIEGPMAQMVPTVGHLAALLPVHLAMHVGQIQVIRRKLNKPILF